MIAIDSLRTFAAAAALALLLPAAPALAVCGDDVVDGTEQCDGGPCCEGNCTFSTTAAVCRPAVNGACDVSESCNGSSGDCPADVLVGCNESDGIACTVPACTVEGSCTEADQCTETCRGAGFWAKRSVDDRNGNNTAEALLAETGPLEVCGQTISSADELDTLDSLVEALCVRTQGVEERQLYRQLVIARLNCALSEGGDCDDILSRLVDVSFSDCSALCAGNPVADGPTVEECRHDLSCFNKGGRLIDGQCALGTCEGDPTTFCGADFGDCSNLLGEEDDGDESDNDCERFEDSCARAGICTTELDVEAQICPAKPKGNDRSKTCQAARKNQCTIDDCN